MLLNKLVVSFLFSAGFGFSKSMYPSQEEISKVFSLMSGTRPNYEAFFSHVSPTVNWTIEGTHPAAGQYNNRTVLEATFSRIAATGSKKHPLVVSLINVVGGDNEAWSVEELQVYGICKNGLVFDNRYAWVTRWNTEGMVIEARAYLDSALVSAALQQNEIGTLFAYNDPRDVILPYVDLPEEVVVGASGLAGQVS